MRINCPHCGERDASEFVYGGDATKDRPDSGALNDPQGTQVGDKLKSEFFEYVYKRRNPAGEHQEYWYHGAGCRAWLQVMRNTLTHKIDEVKAVKV